MNGFVLGIDLGTTNSVTAVADGSQVRVLCAPDTGRHLIPSVVSFAPDGSIAVGEQARERRLIDPSNTVYSVKRLIGRPYDSPEVRRAQQRFAFDIVERDNGGVAVQVRDQTYTLTEISAFVLRQVRRIAEPLLGQRCERAVITVPANFNELQRSATKAAAKVAGIEVARIINEPTAAALAYGYRDRAERVAVYDLGGGTFDITILELDDDVFEVVSTAGDTFLGGDDIDLLVAEHVAAAFEREHGVDPRADRQAFERLRAAAEWLKCTLSAEAQAEVELEDLVEVDARGLGVCAALTRQELEAQTKGLLDRSLEVCDRALGDAKMNARDIDQVVLVGGSTRMPLVRRMVAEHFGREPRVDIDPDLVVAQGAAIQGYTLAGRKAPKSLDEVLGPAAPVAAAEPSPGASRRATLPELPVPPADAAAAPAPTPSEPRLGAALFELEDEIEELDVQDVLLPADDGTDAAHRGAAPLDPLALSAAAPAPDPDDDGPPPRRGEEPQDSIVVDPSYVARLEELAPGQLQHYDVAEELDVDLDLELERVDGALPDPSGASEGAPTGEPEASELDRADPLPVPPSAPAPAAAPTVAAAAIVAMPAQAPPLLMDVTPQSLGLETAGGYCQHIVGRNAPIPAEQTRTFSTARDGQEAVVVRVCQGESRSFEDNQLLGEVELSGIRSAPRGQVRIEVTFILDQDGTLDIKAKDIETGRQQEHRINLLGGLDEEEIEQMRQRQQAAMPA